MKNVFLFAAVVMMFVGLESSAEAGRRRKCCGRAKVQSVGRLAKKVLPPYRCDRCERTSVKCTTGSCPAAAPAETTKPAEQAKGSESAS